MVSTAPRAAGRVRRTAVDNVIRAASSAAAATILVPLSVFDAALILPIQHRMVRDIASIHRCRDVEKARHRVFRALRSKLTGKYGAIVGIKMIGATRFIPVVGSLIGMAVAFALTRTLGHLSDEYFAGGCTMSFSRMAARFDVIFKKQYERAFRELKKAPRKRPARAKVKYGERQVSAPRRAGPHSASAARGVGWQTADRRSPDRVTRRS